MPGFGSRVLDAGGGGGNISDTGLLASNNNKSGRIYIMKGAVPADFSTLTSFSARSGDVLASWAAGYWTAGEYTITYPAGAPIRISTSYKAATATGTATWVWWNVTDLYTPAPLQQIIGTVGTIGSGADLEVGNVNFVAGSFYRVVDFKIQFPSSWTYA